MMTQENIPYTAEEIKAMAKTIESLRKTQKKYKEALERARTSFSYPDYPGFMRVDVIFPELAAESEGERIRKGIIRNLQYLMDKSEGFVKEDLQEKIAWLEKQGKHLDPDKVIEWLCNNSDLFLVHRGYIESVIEQFKRDFAL